MDDPTREESLAHFGIRGQKWGVRNQKKPISDNTILQARKKLISAQVKGSTIPKDEFKSTLKTAKTSTVSEKINKSAGNMRKAGFLLAAGALATKLVLREFGDTSPEPVASDAPWSPKFDRPENGFEYDKDGKIKADKGWGYS